MQPVTRCPPRRPRSGLELGELLLSNPELVRGREVVLEIGTGLGTAAVCAALASRASAKPGGLQQQQVVWATDIDPRALAFTAANARENGLEGTVRALRWDFTRPPPSELHGASVGLLLAADVTYFDGAAARVAELALQLVAPGGALLFVDGTDRPYDAEDNMAALRARLCGSADGAGSFEERTLREGERELAGPQAGVKRCVRASVFSRTAAADGAGVCYNT